MEITNKIHGSLLTESPDGTAFSFPMSINGKPAFAIELTSQIAKCYAGYSEMREDLIYTKELVSILDKNVEFSYKKVFDRSIYREIVMLYSKCFRNADRRRIKLDVEWLKGIQPELLKHHESLTSITNSHFAHAGISNQFRAKTYLLWPQDTRNPIHFTIQFAQAEVSSRNDKEFIKTTNGLIDFLITKIEVKLEELQKLLFNEVNAQTIEHWNEKAKTISPLEF